MVEEASFPRGSSRPAKTDEIPKESNSNTLRPSQKRKSGSGETTAPTVTSVKKDFLFGSGTKKDDGKTLSSSKRRKTDDAAVASSNKNSLLPLGGGGVTVSTKNHKLRDSGKSSVSTTAINIESLGFSKMAKGSRVLACVREVHEQYVIVSLPNLLTAYILSQTKAEKRSSYPLVNMLHVGQTLAVVVTKITTEQVKEGQSRRRIQVSALPQAVNPRFLLAGESGDNKGNSITSAANRLARASVPLRGQILSVEDHGCVIELGFGKRGFLRFDQVGGSGKEDKNYIILEEDEEYEDEEDDDPSKRPVILQKGRIYDFFVLPVTASSGEDQYATTIFPLSLPKIQTMAKKSVSSLTSNDSSRSGKRVKNRTKTVPFSFSSLMPGWLVQVKVEAIATNGLCVSLFGNVFRGVKIEAIATNGLCVSLFGNVFRGAIEMNHLGATLVPNANEGAAATGRDGGFAKLASSLFREHQCFSARIVAVDVPTKLVRLSMAPHILSLSNPGEPENPLQEFPTVGSIISDCTVVKLDPGIGALLALPPQYNMGANSLLPKTLTNSCDLFKNADFQEATHIRKVYVHISKAFDESVDSDTEGKAAITGKFQKEFAPSSRHDVRILNTSHWLDGMAVGGCASSIMKAPVLTHQDLIPGKVYKQVPICAHLPGGSVLVQLGGGGSTVGKRKKSKSTNSHQITGLVPPAQLFDIISSDSSEYRQRVFKTKYAIDAKIDVRVLWVDPLRKKCLVSAKKTLVQAPPENILKNYADAKVGQLAVGFVSRVDDQGLCITFCNRVYGKVTARSLAAELGMEDHRENYNVGDVVTSRVVKLKDVSRKDPTSNWDDDDYENEMDIDDDGKENHAQSSSRRKHWELTLSLKVHKDEDEDDKIEEEEIDVHSPKQVRLLAGAILPEKSMKIVELFNGKAKKSGGYVPGYAIVSIKSKYLVDEDSLGKNKMLSYIECKLPYSNLLDSFDPADITNAEKLDALAKRVLTVGKKIKQKGIVLEDPQKQIVDYASGIGTMPVVSLRKALIQTREDQRSSKGVESNDVPIVPLPSTNLFVGIHLLGFVVQIDARHGAFIRFLDGMTGMVPKKNGGLQLRLYDTLVTKVTVIDDSVNPHRFLLEPILSDDVHSSTKHKNQTTLKVGDIIPKAKLLNVGFEQASLTSGLNNDRLFLHCTSKSSDIFVIKRRKRTLAKQFSSSKHAISKCHPFYGLKNGQELQDLTVVSVQRNKVWVEEKNDDEDVLDSTPTFFENTRQLKPGMKIKGIVAAYGKENNGIFVHVGPQVMGFISGLELSRDTKLLNDLTSNVPLGAIVECMVIKLQAKRSSEEPFLLLSVLACESNSVQVPKPSNGDLVVGRINTSIDSIFAPSLMLDLRQGIGRCCITELDEPDEWENLPLRQNNHVKSDHADEAVDDNDGTNEDDDTFANKKYVECRVLNNNLNGKVVDVSLRPGRINGDLDDDPAPNAGDIVQGYVIQTTKKGCFLRFSRAVEGRSTLKEICDGYIANPTLSFPMGRLVVGKIKETRSVSKKRKKIKDYVTIQVDVDMRESVLVQDNEKLLSFEDINVGEKYGGTVQTVTTYGVFVRIENSLVDGLVHLSESSDKFVKDLQSLYSPGDMVKILVIKKDDAMKKLGFSMKASHFEDDDTDDSSIESDVEMGDSDDDIDDESMEIENDSSDNLNSDDENFATKLATKMDNTNNDGTDQDEDDASSEDDNDDSDNDDNESSSSEDESDDEKARETLDTNVGFSWDASALGKKAGIGTKQDRDDSSDESESDSDDDETENVRSKSRKSRKRQAEKRLEEQEISRRETALADGTADDNPETIGDFERLLAGDPNNSELWIRYMAFHLSLADIASARKVAEKALERIELREENEKLNVWSALLKLEHKFGNEETFKDAIDNACKQNNPKHVYLRACEIRANDVEISANDPTSVSKADALFKIMCKKHKSKKKVWLAHMEYLLKQSRHEDAQTLMKRAMLSLEPRKHAETMSKYAQKEFELGNPERGRTIFDGLILKYTKRLDLFFVYLDKECKFGSIEHARAIIEKKVKEQKLSDRQMKSLFKKWYRIEEEHGTEETQEHVKESARIYVTSSRN
eukprot:CAMPEP_0197198668 /NCGR_PEP_ID=MMETSP1423-20130617/33486_1 /TAXON_ID=476441 /ORGANISM="Pseudo-nitzschia heimii, Strain UNC1101" /LENGTH=2088 /DNA_ID=CAMNT_0042652503 /DNA_START=105 /DNA_END=6374 /DNA_ORIENTATION=-